MGEEADGAAEDVPVAVVDSDEELEFEGLEEVDDLDPPSPTPRPTANAMIAISNNIINNQNVHLFTPHTRFFLMVCGGGASSTGNALL
ncbi:hypothetical protein BPOR_0846g00060 [Botrytis porri]|uniref:Uncharacterized protein n=1 Tax=Botrytis porri TaxID=87229 RepID=A0A4Z1KLW6_9HELO|nr:hypothetical protein BPOR_0846g00060 [Botrytis porri]